MITYLKVRNLAIVEEFAIEPGAGLNVLTGETGAGKSLLIDSLELLRGARGSAEMIRAGTDRLSAEAIFELPAAAAAQLEALGVDVERGGQTVELIVRREIAAGGRGRVLVNGSPVPVRDLAEAMDAVLEIHGQSESHERVAGQSYRELLDEFGAHGALLDATHATYDAWSATAAELRALTDAQRDRELRLDLLGYQLGEISAAKLQPGEEKALREERALLANARAIAESASAAFALVEDDENAATSQIARAVHLLQPLTREIPSVAKASEELQDALYRLQETARGLGDLISGVRHDPVRLDAIEERLVTIERMEKKYGGSVEAVLEHEARIRDEYDRLTDYEANLGKLRASETAKFEEYRTVASRLSEARKKSARAFQQSIQNELGDLAMERTTVRVVVEPTADGGRERPSGFGPAGFDKIDILIAPNRGEEPKPMQRIASGGELSRIQLAIAAALFKASQRAAAATLVFDEIDAGIGGRVAEVVGRKLRELATRNQVICVTHLPQIASFGTTHFYVWKEDDGGQTRARIQRLDEGEPRIAEIARMLGGERVAASALAHARELLDSAAGGRSDAAMAARTSRRR